MATSYTRDKQRTKLRFGTLTARDWTFVGSEYVLGPTTTTTPSRSIRESYRTLTSTSTKPWGASGKPTLWTNHQNRWYEVKSDWLEGRGYTSAPGKPLQRGITRQYSGSLLAYAGLNGDWGLFTFPEAPSDAELYNKLLGKLKSEFNAAVSLAEAHKAVGLIAQNATRIAKAFDFVVQGKRRAAMEILNLARLKGLGPATKDSLRRRYRNKKEREIATTWLELQYGWIPLVNDVYNAVEHARNPPKNPIVRCGSRREHFQKTTIKNAIPLGSGYFSQERISKGSCSRRIVLEYRIDTPYLDRLSSVSLTNPLIVAWELLPFSFVIDWFLPIGSWLNGLDATLGLTFLRSVETYVRKIEQTDRFYPDTVPSWVLTGAGMLERSVIWKDRTLGSSFPTPAYPQLKNPLSVTHATNALALLTSAFKVRK